MEPALEAPLPPPPPPTRQPLPEESGFYLLTACSSPTSSHSHLKPFFKFTPPLSSPPCLWGHRLPAFVPDPGLEPQPTVPLSLTNTTSASKAPRNAFSEKLSCHPLPTAELLSASWCPGTLAQTCAIAPKPSHCHTPLTAPDSLTLLFSVLFQGQWEAMQRFYCSWVRIRFVI